jgi:hypothetical protein
MTGMRHDDGLAPHPAAHGDMTNAVVAARLREVATLLEDQGANPFRVQAYRTAADTMRALDRPLIDVVAAEGLAGLDRLPGIGHRLAAAIRELVVTGRLPLLDRLRGESDPVALLASLPGIGPTLAARLHDELEIDSLEALEAAAYDGRLRALGGFGDKRLAAVRDTLALRLGAWRQQARETHAPEAPVGDLLAVDREYRERAAAGALPVIAPRRLNPEGAAWLPVLHTELGGRHYTALFSNTPRAHELAKTRDWVVLYYDGAAGERQCTVVTQPRGPLRGRRVVRGREAECASYYQEHPHAA